MKNAVCILVSFILGVSVMALCLISGCVRPADLFDDKTELPLKTNSANEVDFSQMIPNPKSTFSNGKITVTDSNGGKSYIFEVSDFVPGDFEKYVAECKNLGFTEVAYENDVDFGAYTEDKKYWVQVNLDKTKKMIFVICQESKKSSSQE